jgi:hypothetical protein
MGFTISGGWGGIEPPIQEFLISMRAFGAYVPTGRKSRNWMTAFWRKY